MAREKSTLNKLVWLGTLFAFFAVTIAVIASWLLYRHTIDLLTNNLRERLLSISITQAANIRPDLIRALQVEQDWVKPEWASLVTRLKRAKDSNPNIVFMYVFRKNDGDPTRMEFVADAESLNPYANVDSDPTNDVDANGDGTIDPEGADKLQWPGQPYPEAADIPETWEAYSGPTTARELYEDSYGRVLTGYAPIIDDTGNVVAILATDIKADDFLTVTNQTLYPFLLFIAGLIFIIAFLAATLVTIWLRRATMLAHLSEQLERANLQQETLLHFISHEVKGFLTAGQNAFAGILDGDYGLPPAPMKTLAQDALLKMRQGVETVMNILDASNLKRGTILYKKEMFDVGHALAESVEAMRPRAAERGLSLVYTSEGTSGFSLRGDREKIVQHVMRNLIDNAIRYTPSGSITVSLTGDASRIRLSVKDTGVGITPEDMSRLFTEGGHGKESIKVNVDSTGYGLFIAKQVVEAHGGTIRAESAGSGKGSEFIVEFPTGSLGAK